MTHEEAEQNRVKAHAKYGTVAIEVKTTWCDYYGTPFDAPDGARPFVTAMTRKQAEENIAMFLSVWPDLLEARDRKIREEAVSSRIERLENIVVELADRNGLAWPRIA